MSTAHAAAGLWRVSFLQDRGRLIAVLRIVASFVVFTGAWELIVRVLGVSRIILPPPSLIFADLVSILTSGLILQHLQATLLEISLGFILGAIVGVLLGMAIAAWRVLDDLVYPYVVAFNSVPKVALAPLMVTWFGFGLSSKIVMALLMSFFPVLVNTIAGLRSVDAQQLELMRALDASKWQVFLRVRIPSSLPYIFAGLEVGVVVSVIGAIVGEFIGASDGLGYLLVLYNARLAVGSAFAILLILGATGMLLHQIIVFARRRIVHWAPEEQDEVRITGV
jgi:NitT/TauT family transport system permease protein